LNTVPLVWGAVNGPQRGTMDLSFAVPSVCSERVVEGGADVGIMPVIEMANHGLDHVRGIGIGCRGAVRSILLVSKTPWHRIRLLAADSGSRTSVQLARIVLANKYGAHPAIQRMDPDLDRMLEQADAALLIGDAALAVDPGALPYPSLDLGAEWAGMTGKPMVFALWAGRKENLTPRLGALLRASFLEGRANLERIIEEESLRRGFPRDLVAQYLNESTNFVMSDEDYDGLRLYLAAARRLERPVVAVTPAYAAAERSR
jgi:predicted solute-binding protein